MFKIKKSRLALAGLLAWVLLISGRTGAVDAYTISYENVMGLKSGTEILFEAAVADDRRPRDAIAAARAWASGEMPMMTARALGGHAMGAARPLTGAPRFAAYAAGQAVLHFALRALGPPLAPPSPPPASGAAEGSVDP